MAFKNLIGQERIKKKLDFYVNVHKKTGVVPFLNFIGARGLGKTAFCREFAKNLLGKDGNPKKLIELNSSTIKSVGGFLEQIWLPYGQDKEVVFLLDEAHLLPMDLVCTFLTILNTEDYCTREFNAGDMTYQFDFSRQVILFATTDPQMMADPLKDRLTTVELSDYSIDELKRIFELKLPQCNISEEALDMIAETTRANARSCVLQTKKMHNYCEVFNIKDITKKEMLDMFDILGVLPHGLNSIEWSLLEILRRDGKCTLTALAAKTGLSRNAIQREYETFLLRKGFINIDGLRSITSKGLKVLEKPFA